MYFLTDPLVQLALHHFDGFVNPGVAEGDWFFGTFGPGNLLYVMDRPFERFSDYEELLQLLHNRNPSKYEQIHKGTPFFFLAWTAFDLRNYEKTLYYLDAAISEDVKNAKEAWISRPGAAFLKLSSTPHVAERVISKIRALLIAQTERFNAISSLPPITLEGFIKKFVERLMTESPTRTIISSIYVYLLEAEERRVELQIKSTLGTSLGPIIAHLFSGGLIVESLLKYLYAKKDNGQAVETLGDVYYTSAFKADFGVGIQTRAGSIKEILESVTDNSFITAFSTISRLRNTTGHNLIWDNIFDSTKNYETLLNQSLNALLFLIERKFIR